MADRRRQLGTFSVFSLVLLRLATGWHFFQQGTEKIQYDAHEGRFEIAFSAEPFLSQAKGPLAGLYQQFAPSTHRWPSLLAVARQDRPPTADEAAERAEWQADYERRRNDAAEKNEPVPVEFPPSAPYADWARQICDDWKQTLTDFTAISQLSDEQRRAAADAFVRRQQQLTDYFAAETDAIVDYRHQLWRLANWRVIPEADGVPFQEQRIAIKTAETAAQPQVWVNQVREFERDYHADLHQVLTTGQRADAAAAAALEDALTDARTDRLEWLNLVITVLTMSVGVCLLLGFFTRLASLVGALFLLGVIASQPFWVPGAESTVYQTIEMFGLLVLAGTGAGRWFGLDFFTHAMFGRKGG